MFCYKCGYELPENSKFCPKCGSVQSDRAGTIQEPKYEQPLKKESKYKIDATKRVGLVNDQHRSDPRFKAMTVYVFSQIIAVVVSVVVTVCFYMSDETVMGIYYDYVDKYRHHLTTWEFVGSATIGTLVCFAVAIIVSYIQLKKYFYSSRAAIAIILYGKLEVGELRFTNENDDIEFVTYFMKKYGNISRGVWILPIGFILFVVFVIPRMI